MAALRGPVYSLAAFAAAFALHIAAGATDQGWLFAVAVVLIFALAAAFPVASVLLGQPRAGWPLQAVLAVGLGVGCVLMAGTLWAANDRAWAWWTWPAAAATAAVATLVASRVSRAVAPAAGRAQPAPPSA